MKKVGIAALKARLSEHLKLVRRGQTLLVMDRETPVARIVPYVSGPTPVVVHGPKTHYRTLGDIPITPVDFEGDPLEALWEERADRFDREDS